MAMKEDKKRYYYGKPCRIIGQPHGLMHKVAVEFEDGTCRIVPLAMLEYIDIRGVETR